MNIRTRRLDPDELYLIEPLLEDEFPAIDPNWGCVIASIDLDSNKVVGFVALQLVLHAEPIVIAPELRGTGFWRELAEYVDGYLGEMQTEAVYTQPLHPNTEAICEKIGYKRCEKPLYVKRYFERPLVRNSRLDEVKEA